jgi:quinohemoprotein ethanol dehydrogenase
MRFLPHTICSSRRVATGARSRPGGDACVVLPRVLGLLGWAALAAASSSCTRRHQPGDVTAQRLAAADRDPENWYTLGRDADQNYFSPLSTINAGNVAQLGFAWAYDLGTTRGQEATPIVVDGVMYTSGYVGLVYALDAATGREIWRFDPHPSVQSMRNPCCDAVNRGVAVWEGRVYVASVDGRLHSLDAATGHEVWSVDTFIDHAPDYASTGAPIVAHHVVVIGNSGGDMERGGVRGYVSAYDLRTGALRWRFFTVPPAPGKPLEHAELGLAAKSWAPSRSAEYPGGATVWDGMTYDPSLNLLYFGTGNAAPYDLRKLGPGNGDMLFACSILALDPDNGRMAWYYQTTPGDKWDYDATQKLVLADLTIDGQLRHVIMQANKNGFFYVLDRETGGLLAAKPFAYVNWASSVDPATGRPVVTSQAEYYGKPKNIYPSAMGAHTWQPMSFDPHTALVYIPALDMSNLLFDMETNGGRIKYVNGVFTIGMITSDDTYDPAALRSLYGALPSAASLRAERPGVPMTRELLRAWDPVSERVVWEHETASGIRRGEGGILSTGGNLVFEGQGDGQLVVYTADSGRTLATIPTGSHIMAAPITYAVDGVQYVAVQTGFGGAGMTNTGIPPSSVALTHSNENRIVAFKLGGGPVPVPPPRPAEPFPPPPPSMASKAEIAHGEIKFVEQCSRCHVFAPNVTPDLRKLPSSVHTAFTDIVLNGVLSSHGMEKFDDLVTASDVDAIHAYLIDLQRQGYREQQRR